jgi:hypothetical protein
MLNLWKYTVCNVVFCCLCILAAPAHPFGTDHPAWTWHEADTELYDPQFSPAGDEIALVRKRHVPDGAEAEMTPEAQIEERFRRIDQNERYADPEVIVLKIGSGELMRLDWGWAPSFSPDAGRIAYAHQTKPISRLRVLAETLKGNEVRVFDRNRKTGTTLVKPEFGYLSDPIFAPDGKFVIYSIGDATNGAYGGNVGIGRVDVESKVNEILYPPTKEYELYHLIPLKLYVSGELFALRARPTGPGIYLAPSYVDELLKVGPPASVVYSWGQHDWQEQVPIAFAAAEDGGLLVYNGGWRKPGDKVEPRRGSPPKVKEDPGVPCPDGRLVVQAGESTLLVRELSTQKALRSLSMKGHIQFLTWSSDSRRFAVIVTKYRDKDEEIPLFDELVVVAL